VRSVPSALRVYALAACLAVGSAIVAVTVAAAYDIPLRDPDGIAGPAYIRLPAVVLLFVLADVVPRAVRRRGQLLTILRERYSPARLALVVVGLASFYVTYVAYRNLKGALPFARPRLYDAELTAIDRAIGFGNDPGELLHALLGTGFTAYFLSGVYLFFLAFVPLSLGAALVWGRSARLGSWYVTALCLNWLLGTASYFLVPSLGPIFWLPEVYADLPDTGVAALQESLQSARIRVLDDPDRADALAGIAGFASLHTSIVFTAALMAHWLRMSWVVRWSMWVFLLLTIVATAYFGWHYLLDDVAGLVIGALSVVIAERATRHTDPEPGEPSLARSDRQPPVAKAA
jgi:membrane-associated phospholipid phosphatase